MSSLFLMRSLPTFVTSRVALGLLGGACLAAGCGGATTAGSAVSRHEPGNSGSPATPAGDRDRWLENAAPGGRIRLALPAGAVWIPHTTTFFLQDGRLSITVHEADAEPGHEQEVVMAALGAFREMLDEGETVDVTTRGDEVLVRGDGARTRVRGRAILAPGAVGIVACAYQDAALDALADRVLARASLDRTARLDASRVLGLELTPVSGLVVASETNAMVVLHEADSTSPHTPTEASGALVFLPTPADATDDQLREMASASPFFSFASDSAEPVAIEVDHMRGFELLAEATLEATRVHGYVAALRTEGGVFLFSASVANGRPVTIDQVRETFRSLRRRRVAYDFASEASH